MRGGRGMPRDYRGRRFFASPKVHNSGLTPVFLLGFSSLARGNASAVFSSAVQAVPLRGGGRLLRLLVGWRGALDRHRILHHTSTPGTETRSQQQYVHEHKDRQKPPSPA